MLATNLFLIIWLIQVKIPVTGGLADAAARLREGAAAPVGAIRQHLRRRDGKTSGGRGRRRGWLGNACRVEAAMSPTALRLEDGLRRNGVPAVGTQPDEGCFDFRKRSFVPAESGWGHSAQVPSPSESRGFARVDDAGQRRAVCLALALHKPLLIFLSITLRRVLPC